MASMFSYRITPENLNELVEYDMDSLFVAYIQFMISDYDTEDRIYGNLYIPEGDLLLAERICDILVRSLYDQFRLFPEYRYLKYMDENSLSELLMDDNKLLVALADWQLSEMLYWASRTHH